MLYDVVVAGATPARSATAREIAREDFKVLLREERGAMGLAALALRGRKLGGQPMTSVAWFVSEFPYSRHLG